MSKVDIIIRTKDREIFLERALNSLSKQTFRDYNVIIVNDGGNAEIVREVVSRHIYFQNLPIKVTHNEFSTGHSAAMNKGLLKGNSPYVMMFDDDDTLEPEFLEKCVKYLDERNSQNCMGVMTHCKVIEENFNDGKITFIKEKPHNNWMSGMVDILDLYSANVIQPCSFVYRREIHNIVGIYNIFYESCEDWEFYLRFLQNYDIAIIPEELSNYHLRVETDNVVAKNSVRRNRLEVYRAKIKNALLRKGISPSVLEFRKDKRFYGNEYFDLLEINKEIVIEFLNYHKEKNICFYGCGIYFEEFLRLFEKELDKLDNYFFADSHKHGEIIKNYKIYSPVEANKADIIVILLGDAKKRKLDLNKNKIIYDITKWGKFYVNNNK